MTLIQGQSILVGAAKETAPNTENTSTAYWYNTITPPQILPSVDKKNIESSVGRRSMSRGDQITRKMFGGDLSMYVTPQDTGLWLLSCIGKNTTTAVSGQSGAYDHKFTVDFNKVELPTLTIPEARLGFTTKDLVYTGAVVSSLAINTQADEIPQMTASIMARGTADKSTKYTPVETANNKEFSQNLITVKFGDAHTFANQSSVNVINAETTINNNAKGLPVLGKQEFNHIAGGLYEASTNVEVYMDDDDYRTWLLNGTNKSVELTYVDMLTTIGASTNPSITIKYPNVSITERAEDRSQADEVKETLTLMSHDSSTANYQVEVTLRNTIASY